MVTFCLINDVFFKALFHPVMPRSMLSVSSFMEVNKLFSQVGKTFSVFSLRRSNSIVRTFYNHYAMKYFEYVGGHILQFAQTLSACS